MSQHQHNKKRLSPWVILGGIAAMLLLLAMTPVLVFVIWSGGHGRQVSARIERIKSVGEPVSGEDLTSAFPLKNGVEDVTKLWMEGVDALESEQFKLGSRKLPYIGTESKSEPKFGTSWPEIDQAEAFLKEHQVTLDTFHEAARRGGYGKFPVDYSKALQTLLPYTQKIRGAARLLRLEFEVKSHRGDADGAAKTMKTMLVVSRSVELEPTLVSQLVALAVDSVATSALAEKLCLVSFSEADLREIQALVRSKSPRKNTRTALLGERAMGYTVMRHPELMGTDRPPIPPLNSDVDCYLEFMERYIAAQEEDFPACLDKSAQIDSDLKQKIGDSTTRMTIIYTSLLLPAISVTFDASARTMATLQAADSGIAVELYRRDSGAPPKSLSELVPKYLPSVPTDPQTGQPMLYKVTPEGFTIYSVGKNRVDDGGSLDQKQTDVGLYFPLK